MFRPLGWDWRIGVATLAEYVFHVDLGLDALLFREPHPALGSPYPERMSQATALSFTCAGAALAWLDARRAQAATQALALVVALVSLTALVGYAYGVRALYAVDPFSSVALHTALGLGALAIGILCARPDRGMVAVLIGDTAGGAMARRLLPLAFGLPPHAYQVRVRIARARELLAAGAAVKQVSAELGFADQSHFGRHFRKATGLTPAEYQRRVTGRTRAEIPLHRRRP